MTLSAALNMTKKEDLIHCVESFNFKNESEARWHTAVCCEPITKPEVTQ